MNNENLNLPLPIEEDSGVAIEGRAPNNRIRRMIEEAVNLEFAQAQSAGTIGYIAHFLAQATLPHSDPKTNYFERGTGKISLSITANPMHGLPFGAVPRLLLAWMCTEAVKKKSPELKLGRSQTEFLNKLNLYNNGHYIKTVKNQSLRLLRSMISVSGEFCDGMGLENMLIAKKAFIFWDTRPRADQPALWESTMTLSTDFYLSLMEAPVPIKLQVLEALKKSPLAMDIYTWLVYRMFTLNMATDLGGGKRIAKIPWESLALQFGASYKSISDFKKNFKNRLREVFLFYPEAQRGMDYTETHLILRPTALHIPYRKAIGSTREIVFDDDKSG